MLAVLDCDAECVGGQNALKFCHLCVHRVSSREDRAPPEHAGQPRGQSHTPHGGHVDRRRAFPRHREYCEFALFFDVRWLNIAVKLAGSAFTLILH